MENVKLTFLSQTPHGAANNNEDWLWDDRAALVVQTYYWRTNKTRMESAPSGARRASLHAVHRRNLQLIQRTWALLGRLKETPISSRVTP
jgi:hypothetical protein